MTSSDATHSGLESTRDSPAALFAFALTVIAIWMLQYPYLGIAFNDSTLYSIQALGHLHPDTLGSDIFLKYGSQDRFTLFSPLFAAAIRILDLEPAAAVLSFISQLAFLAGAWILARRLMPARSALLAIGLLIALPSSYGIDNFFAYIESFLTPRQMTEALVLASLAAALAQRYVLCAACLIVGALLHPIMALSGGALLFCQYVAMPRPRIALMLCTTMLLAGVVLTVFVPTPPFAAFPEDWLRLVANYTPYLFPTSWPPESWSRVAATSVVLAAGALMETETPARRICRASLILAAAGIGISLVFAAWLHSVLVTQMQCWRWLWLSQVIGVLMLPQVAAHYWRRGAWGRTALIGIASTWVLREQAAGLVAACVTLMCLFASRRFAPPRAGRLLEIGSWALLALTLVINLTSKSSYLTLEHPPFDTAKSFIENGLRPWGKDGIAYAAFLILIWNRTWATVGRLAARAALSASAIACLWIAPTAFASWTDFHYTPELRARFTPWREAIPVGAEVIWPGTPIGAWYLLERPSYYSIHQVAGDIFSRQKALAVHRRAVSLGAALVRPGPAGATAARKLELPANADKLDADGFKAACGDADLGFLVSWSQVLPTPYPTIAPDPDQAGKRLHLYRCPDGARVRDDPPAPS